MPDYASNLKLVEDCKTGEKTPFARKIRGTYHCSVWSGSRVCQYQRDGENGIRCDKLSYPIEPSEKPAPDPIIIPLSLPPSLPQTLPRCP